MGSEAVLFDVTGKVATITLNRPEVLNSFNGETADLMSKAWCRVRDDDGIHVTVLRAAGDRAFSTGADIRSDTSWIYTPNIWNTVDPGKMMSPKQHHRVWKPVVAAVHGMCAGGGQYFINEADIIICSDDAEFFDPHANGGITSALEPIGLLARGVPLGDVLRWALMGNEERITAQTALRLGIVTEVVARDALWDRAQAIAESIAARPSKPIQGTVRAIWESLDMTRSMAIQNGLSYTFLGRADKADIPARSGRPVERR